MTKRHSNLGIPAIDCDGILFIGDPHASSRRPGRRKDADFVSTVIGKLDEAIAIANRENLLPVITGDLFDDGDENRLRLLTRLIRALKHAHHQVRYLPGNHSMTVGGSILRTVGDDHAITLLIEADAIVPLAGDGRADLLLRGRAGSLVLGGLSWGQGLPSKIDWLVGGDATKVLVTHHDLGFPGVVYPGSVPLFPIEGIDLVVNGHLHDTMPPALSGSTWFFNPGNTTRQTIDTEGHVPSVWSLIPGREDAADERLGGDVPLPYGIRRHVLPHIPNIFDHTGCLVEAVVPDRPPAGAAEFLEDGEDAPISYDELLRREAEADLPLSEDSSIFAQELDFVCADLGVGEEVKLLVQSLI